MPDNRYVNMGLRGRIKGNLSEKRRPGVTAIATLMGGSHKYYVAKNRVDDCWEVRQYCDDKPVAVSFDTQEEAAAKMTELDNDQNSKR